MSLPKNLPVSLPKNLPVSLPKNLPVSLPRNLLVSLRGNLPAVTGFAGCLSVRAEPVEALLEDLDARALRQAQGERQLAARPLRGSVRTAVGGQPFDTFRTNGLLSVRAEPVEALLEDLGARALRQAQGEWQLAVRPSTSSVRTAVGGQPFDRFRTNALLSARAEPVEALLEGLDARALRQAQGERQLAVRL